MKLSYYRFVLATVAFAAMGHADVIYTVTNTTNGATGQADFSFGADTLTVVLTNTTVNPGDVSANLSALLFNITGATGGALSNSTATDFRTVNGGGTFTDSASGTVGWVFSSSGTAFQVDDLVGTGHAGPTNTVIGTPGSGGSYSNANGSIAGNSAHNPFIFQTVTFNFTFTGGVSAASTLSSVGFQFGTTDGSNVFGGTNTGTTPEPASYVMLLSGAGLLALARRYRR